MERESRIFPQAPEGLDKTVRPYDDGVFAAHRLRVEHRGAEFSADLVELRSLFYHGGVSKDRVRPSSTRKQHRPRRSAKKCPSRPDRKRRAGETKRPRDIERPPPSRR